MKLSERDRRTLRALAATLLPEGGPLPSAEAVDAAGSVAAAVDRLPPAQASRVVALIRAFSALALTRGRRFRGLSPVRRERLVGRLAEDHGYRGVALSALKQLILTTWASHPDVTRALGDDGACLADSPAGRAIVAPLLPGGA